MPPAPKSVLLYHPTARSAIATFEHQNRPYGKFNRKLKKFEATPLMCYMCGKAHAVKTYHVAVDSNGFAIVAMNIWKLMQKHNTAGFELSNTVAEPPDQAIGLAPGPKPVIIELT